MHIHILGICGTFMGGLAALAREAGHRVTGCDANVYPPMSDQLRSLGIELIEGWGTEQLALKPDLFVVGNVVTRGNALMEAILNAGLPYTSGPQWLADHVLQGRHVLAVAGTHGKTTTTSMLAWMLEHAGLQPGFLVGGVPQTIIVFVGLDRSTAVHLGLLQPVAARLPHHSQVLAGQLREGAAFVLGIGRRSEGAKDGLEVGLCQQGRVCEVEMMLLDAVLAAARLPMTAMLRHAETRDPLSVLALAHIITSLCYSPFVLAQATPKPPPSSPPLCFQWYIRCCMRWVSMMSRSTASPARRWSRSTPKASTCSSSGEPKGRSARDASK